VGWELFRNFLIAKEKFKPDYFLYENNKSAAPAIKDQISAELGVPLQYIDSALVSAQRRQRFYAHNFGAAPPPADRGILLQDILESGLPCGDKSYCLTATYYNAGALPHDLERHQRSFVAEPVAHKDKANTLRASAGLKQGQSNLIRHIESNGQFGYMGVSVRVGTMPNRQGEIIPHRGMRIYSPEGKAVTLLSPDGGQTDTNCSATGLYAISATEQQTAEPVIFNTPHGFNEGGIKYGKAPPLTANGSWEYNNFIIEPMRKEKKSRTVYPVKDGKIEIKGKLYPIRLPDGYYIIRKLTVTECCRLQTLPDDYFLDSEGKPLISDTQAYKCIGNGWTAEVIIHLLGHALADVPRDEQLVVLSMYDGIATGWYCLDRLGFRSMTYYAYEIDKYAVTVARARYPDIRFRGDAFAVR
jgi:DNA (cytosine-5)-methyltransferase 3A